MRFEDWPERLAEYVDDRRDLSFQWGSNDCGSFAAGAVEAMTGARPHVQPLRSATDYARLLAQHGPLQSLATQALGVDPIHAAHARRGDIVLVALEDRDVLAVCVGASAVAPSSDGLLAVPVESATVAWRV